MTTAEGLGVPSLMSRMLHAEELNVTGKGQLLCHIATKDAVFISFCSVLEAGANVTYSFSGTKLKVFIVVLWLQGLVNRSR